MKTLVYSGLMVALVFVTTFSIKVPVPFTQGYIHMGDSMIFVASILFGWKVGALAGGVGSMLADIVGGYAGWAVPTLIIKSVMGIIVALVAAEYKKKKTAKGIISLLSMGAWVIFGITLNAVLNSVLADSTSAQKLAG
ncbi:MAG TPA: ECF transporter S component [Petrotogaceae bacterium]|nr:ECF transporter S component [Petrotogaceae bacterium]